MVKKCVALLLLFVHVAKSKSFEPPKDLSKWFEENVDYDGVSHRSSYVVFSSDLMGPNALPVPFM